MVTTEAEAPAHLSSASGIEKKKSSKNKDKKSKKRPVDEVEVRIGVAFEACCRKERELRR